MPPNPYRIPLGFGVALLPVGGIALLLMSIFPERSGEFVTCMIVGVLVLTLGVILAPSFLYTYWGHHKRFAKDQIVAQWRVSGRAWLEWRDLAYRRVIKGWLWGLGLGIGIPLLLCGGLFIVDPSKEIAAGVGAIILVGVVLGIVAWLSSGSYRADYGQVWLAREAAQFGTHSIFFKSFGLRVVGVVLREASDIHEIAIDYMVRGKHGEVRNQFTAPVPAEEFETARKWVEFVQKGMA